MYAHRGDRTVAPEHSLAAYVAAIEQGVDGIECDVRLSADGHLVCVHDRRVDRTTNGRGVVSTLGLADLAALDFAARHDDWSDFEAPYEPESDRSSILTLDQLLGLVVDAGRRVEIAIETKYHTHAAGLVERAVVAALRRFGLAVPSGGEPSPVCVMSFSWIGLRRMRALAPRIPTVLLMERVPLRMRDGTLPVGVTTAAPRLRIIQAHPEYAERLHSKGHGVFVWTVNESADIRLCVDAGVDVIITDRPGPTRSTLAALEV